LLPPFDFPPLGFELSFDELELPELPDELDEPDDSEEPDEPPLEVVLLSADADFLYESLR
jgi:hypothetical protein